MEKKYKIGYTTGVYDMFHIGHLNILRRAKEMCDYLVVGVSTDELVEQYKNKKTIIPYEHRREIVQAIRYVDEVVPQINRDKSLQLSTINYDVLFVGSDWKGSPEFDTLEVILGEKNVDVVYLEHTEGVSSSIIRKKRDERNIK